MTDLHERTTCRCVEGLYARELLHRAANTVQQALAAVHLVKRGGKRNIDLALDRLSASAELQTMLADDRSGFVDLTSAVEKASYAMLRSVGAADRVSFVVDAEPMTVDRRLARPVLMAVSELVGNSARHAFGRGLGCVRVTLRDNGVHAIVEVEDDGYCNGWLRPGGQGRGIVDALAASLGGVVERSLTSDGSSRVTLSTLTLAAASASIPGGSA